MQNKIKIEAMDEMQYFFKKCNNVCMYCVIYTNGMIDIEHLKKAVEVSFVLVPALRCRLVTTGYRPYWKTTEFLADKIVLFKNSDDITSDINRAITVNIDAFSGPQIIIHVLRNAGRDIMCFAINHVICDGAGMKEYLYLLGDIYSDIENGQEYQHVSRGTENIKTSEIYKGCSLMQKLKIPKHGTDVDKDSHKAIFLFGGEPVSPFIKTFNLPRERFANIKEFAKSLGCTVNDVIMAADIRATHRVLNLDRESNLLMPCMVDLRKYIEQNNQLSVCNLTSTVTCDIGPEIGNTLKATSLKVKHSMDKLKNDYSSIEGLFAFNCLCSILPFGITEKIMSAISTNPKISITNIGVIRKELMHFSGVKVTNAFMTGAIKYKPYFQLAFSTFDDKVTFSVNLVGSERDKELIDGFYATLDDELPE